MLRTILRHDRAAVIAGLVVVIALAWSWLFLGAGMGDMAMPAAGSGASMPSTSMPGMSMKPMQMAMAWTPGYFALVFSMWAIMMAAMMLPSAAPTILLVDALSRQRPNGKLGSFLFSLGYLIVWAGFSLLATTLQWRLDISGLLRGDMASSSHYLAAALLIAAGIYQLTPYKQACLEHCRSPAAFLTHHWRHGPLRAGLHHGVYCLGCCWALMGLLFVGGVMNLLWIAGLAALVLIEKLLPLGGRISQVTGVLLIAWALFLIAGSA